MVPNIYSLETFEDRIEYGRRVILLKKRVFNLNQPAVVSLLNKRGQLV